MWPPQFQFPSIWVIVVGVHSSPGEQLAPVAIAALDADTRSMVELGSPDLRGVRSPPYPTGPRSLLVTIDANEVIACHLALGWRLPERILDLMVEYRNMINGRRDVCVGGLAGALVWYGLPSAGALVEGSSPDQMRRRLAAVAGLFGAMRASIDLGRALLRGRYLCAVARMEAVGVPVDANMIAELAADWPGVRGKVVESVDRPYGVFRGSHIDPVAFAAWLQLRGMTWPTTAHRHLDLGDDAFREMARLYPDVRPIKELRSTLAGFDPSALTIGRDDRNRFPLRPFASRTSRNQPSTKASVLGTAAWVRRLIKPQPGTGLAMIDWQQQEFGIAAALSGDREMQRAYRSGDPYVALAMMVGAVSDDATAITHPIERERYKACALGVQYGMGSARLARQCGISEASADALIARHKTTFPRFWSWASGIETQALLSRQQFSVFGWRRSVGSEASPGSLRNFPMQANGAEMLRLACCLATERGFAVCAPNHDALLIEAPLRDLDDAVATAQRLMAEASHVVLDGFALRTTVRVVRAPDRWTDQRGEAVWTAVERALNALRETERPARRRHATCSSVPPRTVLLSVSKEDGSNASD